MYSCHPLINAGYHKDDANAHEESSSPIIPSMQNVHFEKVNKAEYFCVESYTDSSAKHLISPSGRALEILLPVGDGGEYAFSASLTA